MHGDYAGVWDGTEHGAHNCPLLGQPHFFLQGEKVPRDTVWNRERSHAKIPRVPHDIFNVVADAGVRSTLEVVCGPQEARYGMGWAARERNLNVYADDGRIGGREHIWAQDAMMVSVEILHQVGLYTNLDKIKALVCTPG